MSSIRSLTLVIALGLVAVGGCVRKSERPGPAAERQPIATDDAMARRSWSESSAKYTNTAIYAGPDRFLYEAKNPQQGVWLDTPLLLVNTVVLPFTYINTGANELVANQTGSSIGPSYTAIPPSPGGSSSIAQNYGQAYADPSRPSGSGSSGGGVQSK